MKHAIKITTVILIVKLVREEIAESIPFPKQGKL